MLSTIKHSEFFDPSRLDQPVHIIGVGAIGSHVAEQLARLGVTSLFLYDFDQVEPANIANQMYRQHHVGKPKILATLDQLLEINPQIKAYPYPNGWDGQALKGYVFLCVDSIEIRKRIVEENQYNPMIKAMFDFRMRLTDAQHYAADWAQPKQVQSLLDTMDFTHEEATAATPVSACGTTLSILPTIRVITALGVANFINHTLNKDLKKLILIDAFSMDITSF